MRIEHFKSINYTPAVVLATKGWLEQNEAGIGEPVASIHWEQEAIVAFDNYVLREPAGLKATDAPVGVMTFTEQKSLAAIYIEQAYVEPWMRRKGIFRAMWTEVMSVAKARGFRFIRLGTHPQNDAARDVYRQLGGNASAVFYSFHVPAD